MQLLNGQRDQEKLTEKGKSGPHASPTSGRTPHRDFGCLLVLAAAKSLQLCPTLCDPIDGNLPGSSIPGILQARTLEWVAISFSNTWKWSRSLVSDSWFILSTSTGRYWQVSINPRQGSPFGGCLHSSWGTMKPWSRAHHLPHIGHTNTLKS